MDFKDCDEKIQLIFEKGSVMYVKHPSVLEPILCIIENTGESSIIFKMPQAFLERNILLDDNLYCHVMKESFEYVAYGIIENIDMQRPKLVSVRVNKLDKYKNNRVFKRYSINMQADVAVQGASKKIYCIIKNISAIGAAMVGKEKIDIGSSLKVRVSTFLSADEFLEFAARVVRVSEINNYYEYGIEITDIDEKGRDILDKVIFSLHSDEDVYIEDLLK